MSIPREQLSEAMRKARLEAGFDTHAKLAMAMNTSRPAISKAENPNSPVPSVPVLRAWARTCRVPVEEFLEIVERAKNGTPEWFMSYLEAEQAATRLRFWEPNSVTGALQTADYCRALLSARHRKPNQLQPLVDMRMQRREVIGRAEVTAVFDHRVLAHCIGSAEIMSGQCAHLAELVENQGLDLHVVPEGGNIGLGGAVAIATRGAVSTVSMSASSRDITSTAADVVDENLSLFDAVLGASLTLVQSLEYVRQKEDKWKEQA